MTMNKNHYTNHKNIKYTNVKNTFKDRFHSINSWTFSEFILNAIKVLLLITFGFSIIVSFYTIIGFNTLQDENQLFFGRNFYDYILMLLQSIAGITIITIPKYILDKINIYIPNFFWIAFYIILFLAIYLGEVNDYYNKFECWDDILHFTSAVFITFFTYCILNSIKKVKNSVHPIFLIIISFFTCIALCSIWEIYEYVIDGIFNTNMQKYILNSSTILIGRNALRDTMQDIIIGTLGSLISSIICYIAYKKSMLIKNTFLISFKKAKLKNKDI